ncbi:MAG: NAD(+)/NADH kinase [Abditibacteriota bacterium]|nr:NAD(+)/NADH kinase [Abditibacteriota bacterium]
MKLRKVGIIANSSKQKAQDMVDELRSYLDEKGIASNFFETYTSSADAMEGTDLMIVLGGDGTILNYARLYGRLQIPILGINFGTLGFIAEIQPEDYREALDQLIEGGGMLSKRIVLHVVVERSDKSRLEFFGLNDLVISHKNVLRMLSLDAYINGNYLVSYNGDGLIVSGPTGSTAYNLSAGGPVLHPEVNALLLTPICPHTLGERPLVIPGSESIRIRLAGEKRQDAMVSVDGQANTDISSDDTVYIGVADYTVDFVLLHKSDFYSKLRTRLFWGR